MTTLPPLRRMQVWLAGMPWERVIGQRVSCTGCPIALWLNAHFRACCVVDEETIVVQTLYEDMVIFETPDDFRTLIDRIDYAGRESRDVMADEVRDALKAVLREQEDV